MYTGAGLAGAFSAGVDDRQFRLLRAAVLASLVLHALILYFLPLLRELDKSRVELPPLTARLVEPKPVPEPPKVEPPPPVASSPVVRPAAKPQPQPSVTPVLSVEPQKQAAEPALLVPAAPPQPAASAEAQPAPAVTATVSGPDPSSIARFRLELMEVALRYERYPRIAQDNGWEGRVELRILIAENGALASIIVRKSAGRVVLDDQALTMLRSAHPHVVVPPSLRGKAFTLDIPVDFSIKELR
jgi:periplasmic protein TonB